MTTSNDWPANPYDFSAPASGSHFAGRAAEKAVLSRYLDGVTETATAHLLIHGRRGIGKSTILGELGRQARSRGLVAATVAVDQSSASDREFFGEVVRGVGRAVMHDGGLGGPDGEYAAAVGQATLGRAVERGAGPLRVIEYLAATLGTDSRVPDGLISDDLAELVDAAHDIDRLGIVLAVDEADQLTSAQGTLQRLRNLVVQAGLVSVVLAGTDVLVSALDGASAPIGRHFRRLPVPPLADRSETRELLAKPLRTAGLNPSEVLPLDVVAEVHTLTNGRPFEVALLGHAMYEDAVARGGDELQLNEAVLDAVIAHVRPSPEDEAAITTIRSLDPEDLRLAAKYCVDPSPSLKEHALLRIAFAPLEYTTMEQARDQVVSDWSRLSQLALAEVEDQAVLRPEFGELSQTYLKYRSRRFGVLDDGIEGRFSDRLAGRVQTELLQTLAWSSAIAYFARSHVALEGGRDPEAWEFTSALASGRLNDASKANTTLADTATQYQREEGAEVGGQWALVLVPFEVGEDGFSHIILFHTFPDIPPIAEILSQITSLAGRTAQYGIAFGPLDYALVDDASWRRLGAARVANLVADFGEVMWYEGRRDNALKVMQSTFDQLDSTDQLAAPLLEPQVRFLNNLGFMDMAVGHMVEAGDSFNRLATLGGLSPSRSVLDQATLLCNLAASCAGLGRYVEAVAWADQCLALRESTTEKLTAGVLAVYIPIPDWPHKPRMAMSPDPFQIAAATRAAALAAMDDADSVDIAVEVVETVGTTWAIDLLEAIGWKLRRPDVADLVVRYRSDLRQDGSEDVDDVA